MPAAVRGGGAAVLLPISAIIPPSNKAPQLSGGMLPDVRQVENHTYRYTRDGKARKGDFP
jgi:hypothetical protein